MWRTKGLVTAEPWSKFVKDSKEKIADWTWPNITGKKDMPADARAYWDETGKFDKYFSPKPGEGD